MAETITEFIKQDLTARLGRAEATPASLTLAALARHYGVSFTPVRLAVQELIEQEQLLRLPNGRLALNPDAPRTRPAAASPPPAGLAAAERTLTDEILRLSLRGRETYLREEATARQLGIGRTVLRQVLSRLAGSGLIEHLPRRGWRVRPFDEEEMNAYLQVRETLELQALDLARPRLEPAALERMLQGNRPAPGSRAERLDNQLHAYLIARSNNRYIQDFFERHGAYHSLLFDFAAPGANVVQAMARQHRAILRALLARDWPRARRVLARHIRAQQPIVRRLLATFTR